MPVDLQRPVDLGRDRALQAPDRLRQLVNHREALGRHAGRAGREQHFRLADEAVADDADVGAGVGVLALGSHACQLSVQTNEAASMLRVGT